MPRRLEPGSPPIDAAASGPGITASQVSAAMAAGLVLMAGTGFSLPSILLIAIAVGIVAWIATSFVPQRLGKDLVGGPEPSLKRVAGAASNCRRHCARGTTRRWHGPPRADHRMPKKVAATGTA